MADQPFFDPQTPEETPEASPDTDLPESSPLLADLMAGGAERDQAPEASSDGEAEQEKGSFKLDLFFWTQALVFALVFLILMSTLVGRLIGVKGSSMLPTLHDGDLLVLQSVGYTPKQGDVVVLRKQTFLTSPIVKRVIATAGQHVIVSYADHAVYVDGVALDEPYINELMTDPYQSTMSVLDVTVPEGSIYVLGDNRNNSSDSRHELLGTVDTRYVLGHALWVLVPFNHFGAVN